MTGYERRHSVRWQQAASWFGSCDRTMWPSSSGRRVRTRGFLLSWHKAYGWIPLRSGQMQPGRTRSLSLVPDPLPH